ncbi:hypothetical protein JOM56_015202 [Amanita muscaria]
MANGSSKYTTTADPGYKFLQSILHIPGCTTSAASRGVFPGSTHVRGRETRSYNFDFFYAHPPAVVVALVDPVGVGILESDPALRKECQRMTVRECRHRKSREMPKEKEDAAQLQQQNGDGNGMMTGCSARANGLVLDIRITDPVKLERRLKRQRSEAGDASTDSHASEKEDAKDPKPARGALDGQQDVDELDIIGPSPVLSPGPQLQYQRHLH